MTTQHAKTVDVYRVIKGYESPAGSSAGFEHFEGEYAKDEAFLRQTDLEKWDWVPDDARTAYVKLSKRRMVLKDEGWKPWGDWEEIGTTFKGESAA